MTDERMDRMIGTLLRVGVGSAAVTVLAGGIWYAATSSGPMPDFHAFRGEPADVRSLGGVLRGVAAGHPLDLIQLGLLMLIATPVARVALSVVAFAMERDRTYLVITAVVLLVLLASLTGVWRGGA